MIVIRYHLSLPANSSEEQVTEALSKVQQICLDQAGFDSVSDIRTQQLDELRQVDDIIDNPQQYLPDHTPRVKIGFVAKLGQSNFEGCLYGYSRLRPAALPWFYDGQSWMLTTVPDEEYVRRHLAVIAALKIAQQYIPWLKVQDEAKYWDHGNRTKLLAIKQVMQTCPDPRDLRASAKI